MPVPVLNQTDKKKSPAGCSPLPPWPLSRNALFQSFTVIDGEPSSCAITDSCGHIIICVLISPDCSKIWPTERGGAPFLDWRGDRNVYWREFPERLEGWGHPLRVSSVCSCVTAVVGPLDLCNGDKSKFHVTLSMFSNRLNSVCHQTKALFIVTPTSLWCVGRSCTLSFSNLWTLSGRS